MDDPGEEGGEMSSFIDCGEILDMSGYSFWCDGVLVSVIGTVGFIGNLLALIVLSRKTIRDLFHKLLFALACFDLMYIVFGGINYTFRSFKAQSDYFTYLFPHVIHPFTHISLAATIFMTVAITIERYLGLCHPFLPPSSRKAWFYILPVIVISVTLNIPKFMEIQLGTRTVRGEGEDGGGFNLTRPSYHPTELRKSPMYIRSYVMWTRLFSTAIIPVSLLVLLNARIIFDLVRSANVQRFGGSFRRQRKEINTSFVLLCIVLIFFCCHAARIVLDVHEFSNVESILRCHGEMRKPWMPSYWMQALPYISHLAMILNSSVNFIVYCLVGNHFRREMCRMFGFRKYASVPQTIETMTNVSRKSSKLDAAGAAAAAAAGGATIAYNPDSTPPLANKVSTVATAHNGIVLTDCVADGGGGATRKPWSRLFSNIKKPVNPPPQKNNKLVQLNGSSVAVEDCHV